MYFFLSLLFLYYIIIYYTLYSAFSYFYSPPKCKREAAVMRHSNTTLIYSSGDARGRLVTVLACVKPEIS